MKQLTIVYKDDTIEKMKVKADPDFVNNFLFITTTKKTNILIPVEAIKRIELDI